MFGEAWGKGRTAEERRTVEDERTVGEGGDGMGFHMLVPGITRTPCLLDATVDRSNPS